MVNGSIAFPDRMGTIKSEVAYTFHGEGQNWMPMITHQRIQTLWFRNGGWFTTCPVWTEKIIILPKLHRYK